MAIPDLCRQLNLNTPLHASIQMGAANLSTVNYLEEKGFNRVILSKNLSLQEIADIHRGSRLGIELFAHGDLCVSHTGHCYMSRLIFGQSGNRGSCKKPCRWPYKLHTSGYMDETFRYYLANNDLCDYPYLAELAQAGVSSFKIEGRMRNAEFLFYLIRRYRLALDRFQDNPHDYRTDKHELKRLTEERIRDYTPGHLWGRPSINSIGLSGEREPHFDTRAIKLEDLRETSYDDYSDVPSIGSRPEMTVKVADMDALPRLKEYHIDNIVLSMEIHRHKGNKWALDNLEDACRLAQSHRQKVYLETPAIVSQSEMNIFELYARPLQMADGIIVNDYGSLYFLQKLLPEKEWWAGPGLNITNLRAASQAVNSSIKRITVPYEMDLDDLADMSKGSFDLEIMVQGPMCAMVTDLCLAGTQGRDGKCTGKCTQGSYELLDEYGQKYIIHTDMNCRNYVYYPQELCLLQQLPGLRKMGLKSLRIEGQFYSPDQLEEIIATYTDALDNLQQGIWQQQDGYRRLLQLVPQGLTTRPFVTCVQES
jgi:putative protease